MGGLLSDQAEAEFLLSWLIQNKSPTSNPIILNLLNKVSVMIEGGINANSVTKSLKYLVLGTYVTDSWAHESFGRKIEKTMEYRDSGLPLIIIT